MSINHSSNGTDDDNIYLRMRRVGFKEPAMQIDLPDVVAEVKAAISPHHAASGEGATRLDGLPVALFERTAATSSREG